MRKGANKNNFLDKAATKADVKEIVTKAFDSFAIKVQNGFKEVHNRIDGVEAKMVTKDEFLPFKRETEQSLYQLKSDMTDVKGRLTRVEGSLGRLEERVDSLEVKMDGVIGIVKNHETRIARLERAA